MSNKIEGSKILITGGAGLVGSHIADQLLEKGVEEIILLDNMLRGNLKNMESALKSEKVRFVEGDIRDITLLDNLFQGIDYCFHMAAVRITYCAANPEDAFEIMHQGTFNVLNQCVKNNVKKLSIASSASVYGQATEFPTTEEHHPYNNRTFYGAAKIANEGICRSYKDMYDMDYTAFRYFNVYGPRMDTEGKYTEVLIRWYYLLKENKQPLIFGDGSQTMDFIYIDDIARATILGLESSATDEVFNVAFGKETSLKELCYALIKVIDKDIEPKFEQLPEERKNVEVGRRQGSTKKAEELIGFKASVGLESGLKKLVQWLDKLNV